MVPGEVVGIKMPFSSISHLLVQPFLMLGRSRGSALHCNQVTTGVRTRSVLTSPESYSPEFSLVDAKWMIRFSSLLASDSVQRHQEVELLLDPPCKTS